jgi:pimeloyl-ACP methyl ester carboxylesterase
MTQFQDFWYSSFDQLRLYARDYGQTENKPALVCIPGLTRNSADFEELCPQLAEDWRILAVDLRGRGRSAYDPNPENYHPGSYARDIQSLLQAADVSEAVFIGTSLGGLVSMTLAAMQPQLVRGIVLNDVGPELNPEGVARIRSYITDYSPTRDWDDALARTRSSQQDALPDLGEEQWQVFTRRLYREDANGCPVLDYDRNIARLFNTGDTGAAAPDLWPLFALLTDIPMLVLRGELSDIITAETVARMQQEHPRLTAVTVARRGHAPMLDEAEALQAIRSYLEAING